MLIVIAAHLIAGLLVIGFGTRLGRSSFVVASLVTVSAAVWGLAHSASIVDGAAERSALGWVPALGLTFDLRTDAFSLVMVLVVAVVATIVLLYAWSYFDHDGHLPLARLAGLLLVFTGAMLGIVTAANLLTLFVAWELTSISSYLLIGWDDRSAAARSAALQALLTTGAGSLAMLAGFVLVGRAAGTTDLAELVARPPSGSSVTVGMLLVLAGAFTKSAQFPFSAWLPGAMIAPTPVSALLHSATMVKAGVYLIARLAPVFAANDAWRPVVWTVGLVTMITGGVRALREVDLKAILAGGTISQLGLLVVLFGTGTPEATEAGIVLLIAHAAFKAALFLVVGMIDHLAHTRDVRALGRYAPGWAGARAIFLVSGASMAGIPLLVGFVGKESALAALVDGDVRGAGIVAAGVVVGSVLTVAYTGRLVLGAFSTTDVGSGLDGPAPDPVAPVARPATAFWAIAAPLAAATVVFGLGPALLRPLVGAATSSIVGAEHHSHLSLWHGLNLPLLLSAVVLASGGAVIAARVPVASFVRGAALRHPGQRAYAALVHGLNRLADRITAIVQPGSLPLYLGVTLTVLAVLPAWGLLRTPFPDLPDLTTGPGDWAAAALIVAGGIAATVVQERIAAVLCLGAVGFGMALVFVLQGAPDLALTQVCIDTLGAVVFVLVLRRLPNRFSDRSTPVGRWLRIGVSAMVGVSVFVFIVMAVGLRTEAPVSDQFISRSLDDGGGRNVVNVVIVDFRGFDTMGEITVLSVAGLGVYGLVRLARREHGELRTFSPIRRERTREELGR